MYQLFMLIHVVILAYNFFCIDVYAKLMFEDHLVEDPSQQVIELPQEIRGHNEVKMNFHELEVHTKLNFKKTYIDILIYP